MLIAVTLVGCSQSDGRADTPEALAAELGWRQDAFILANAGNVAYASRVRDGALEVIGFERASGDWRNSMSGSWEAFGRNKHRCDQRGHSPRDHRVRLG